MGARDILAALTAAGMVVSVDGERLLVRPSSGLTDAQRAVIRAEKAEIMALLLQPPDLQPMPEEPLQPHHAASRHVADDDRVVCNDCRHYRPGRCGNFKRASLSAAIVGTDFAAMPQRCPGFSTVRMARS